MVERLLLLTTSEGVNSLTVALALPAEGATATASVSEDETGCLAARVAGFERATILAELERQGHHITNTAKALGLERSHLYKKCQQLGIDPRANR
jgi:DNA-binding NtrC family response regulator